MPKKNGVIVQRLNVKSVKKKQKQKGRLRHTLIMPWTIYLFFFQNYDRRAIQGIRIAEDTLVIQL